MKFSSILIGCKEKKSHRYKKKDYICNFQILKHNFTTNILFFILNHETHTNYRFSIIKSYLNKDDNIHKYQSSKIWMKIRNEL